MMFIAYSLLLSVAASGLFWIYRGWPPDSHSAIYGVWYYFRRPGEKVPAEIVRRNSISISRIYLHQVVDATLRILGRKDLYAKLRIVQYGMMALSAVALFWIGTVILAIAPPIAFLGSLVFLFMCSRPQFLPAFFNGEPFYNLATTLSLAALLSCLSSPVCGSASPMLFAALYSFAALNTKPNFVIEPVLVGGVFLTLLGWPAKEFLAMMLGGLMGICACLTLLRNHLDLERAVNLWNYVSKGGMVTSKPSAIFLRLAERFRVEFARSPLVGFLFLVGVSTLVGPWDGIHALLVAWVGASLISVIVQTHFTPYHFLVLLPSGSLLITRGLSTISAHSILLLSTLALAAYLSRTALGDFCFYYRRVPLAERMARSMPNYHDYWELRLDLAAAHHLANSGGFISWGCRPELHFLAECPPAVYNPCFIRAASAVCPELRHRLTEELTQNPPQWIYEFNSWHTASGRFNPLGLFALTGLKYLPEQRRENVVFHRLAGHVLPRRSPSPFAHVESDVTYTVDSPTMDLFTQELILAGYRPEALPDCWRLHILELVASLAFGRRIPFPQLEDEMVRLWRQETDHRQLSPVYGAAIFLHRGDATQSRIMLTRWMEGGNPLLEISPVLSAATAALARMLMHDESPLIQEPNLLNTLPPDDALVMARFLMALACTDMLRSEEKEHAFEMLQNMQPYEGPYKSARVESQLRSIRTHHEQICMAFSSEERKRNPLLLQDFHPLELIAQYDDVINEHNELCRILSRSTGIENPKIILYGLSKLGVCWFMYGKKIGMNISSIVDTYKYDRFSRQDLVKVRHPSSILEEALDAIVVCSGMKRSIEEIRTSLRSSGFVGTVITRCSEQTGPVWECK
jgi:hypothetical protein